MKRSRQVATLLMILSLTLGLVACGGSSAAEAPQAEDAQTEEVEAETEEPSAEEGQPEAASEQAVVDLKDIRMAYIKDVASDDVAIVTGEWAGEAYDSVDALAKAIISGKIDVAVVSPDVASALYNATAGSLMAVDAIALPDEAARAVSVVSLPLFRSSPETVVSYVARHQELVSGQLGSDSFLIGSPMQRALASAISDAYVVDPSSVGGELPPDNFYFLG